ncbi:hypothetical protein Tco_1500225 [Tanacetum coccineum]
MPVELGSFDVIIGMDWLAKYHALIVCDEKVVRIPYGNEVLIIEMTLRKIDGGIILEGSSLKAWSNRVDHSIAMENLLHIFGSLYIKHTAYHPEDRRDTSERNHSNVIRIFTCLCVLDLEKVGEKTRKTLSDDTPSALGGKLEKSAHWPKIIPTRQTERIVPIKSHKDNVHVESVSLLRKRIDTLRQNGKAEPASLYWTFLRSSAKKCMADEPLVIPLDEIQVDDKLNFIEEPVEIMDREVKRLKQSRIPIVKVRWNSRRGPEFTWEREDQMQKKYPHLFTNSAPTAEVAS